MSHTGKRDIADIGAPRIFREKAPYPRKLRDDSLCAAGKGLYEGEGNRVKEGGEDENIRPLILPCQLLLPKQPEEYGRKGKLLGELPDSPVLLLISGGAREKKR